MNPDNQTIGRDGELAEVEAFVLGRRSERALILAGPPGIGKTTIWEDAVARARASGDAVLTARASEAESHLPFVTLSDQFDGVRIESLPGLPAPQRRALEVALMRVEATGRAPSATAIALGAYAALRELASERGVLVAIDDLQWADADSVAALAFAARRLGPSSVRFLLARRPGRGTALESAFGDRIELVLEGLSLGGIRHLLATRIGLNLSRRTVRQVQETTLGNPLFALEVGRALVERGIPKIGDDFPVPETLEELLGARASESAITRRALAAVALAGSLAESELTEIVSREAISAATTSGLLTEIDGHLRPAHPLIGAVAVRRSTASERRDLHRALAAVTNDPVRRARHLAAATVTPDGELAAVVAAGAADAFARTAHEQAVELAEAALRLTPAGDHDRDGRVITLGQYLLRADEAPRLKRLLEVELPTIGAGSARARALWLRSRVPLSQAAFESDLEEALRETDDPDIRAQVLAAQALDVALAWVNRLDFAEGKLAEALSLPATGIGRSRAVNAAGWLRLLRGDALDDLHDLLPAVPPEAPDPAESLDHLEHLRLAFRGFLPAARSALETRRDALAALGEENGRRVYHHHLVEVTLRAGDRNRAAALLAEMADTDDSARPGFRSETPRLRAHLVMLAGDPAETRRWLDRTAELAFGQRWDLLEGQRIGGLSALFTGDFARAFKDLYALWRHLETEGVTDPGVFPFAPDLVEAAIGAGNLEAAGAVAARLAVQAAELDHPWALAGLDRSQGLLMLARGQNDPAGRQLLQQSADRFETLGCTFDAARSLHLLGRDARRNRRWAEARQALERAMGLYEALGCDGWAAQARQVLAGLPGRRPSGDGLTASERRTAELASRGLSNKEIAASLFVSVHTVEVHLGRAFPKLGVTSRSQLARALERLDADGGQAIN